MSDAPQLRQPDIETRVARGWRGLSLVWLVPVVAVAGALALVWQSYSNRDIPIRIEFADATGIEVDKTEIRFREVSVGRVSGMRFSEDLSRVIVEAEIHRELERYLDSDARFWRVTARVGPGGISGLNTLLSGAYIAADWDAVEGEAARDFVAEAEAPAVPPGTKGLAVVLIAPDSGSVSVGAPILHKGVQMGKIAAVRYDALSGSVLLTGFIEAPNDKLINSATRFWNVSGAGLELGEGGIQLKVDSLASLLQGGVAFDTAMSGGEALGKRPIFDLYATEDSARDSLLGDSLQATVEVMSSFDGSVRGLKLGSEVVFRGVKVGQVRHLSAEIDESVEGKPDIRMQVIYTIEPGRLGLHDVSTPDDTLSLLATMVARGGVRAQLMPASFFSGGLVVQLQENPDAPAATLDREATPFPIMPSLPTPADTLAVASQNVLDRVAALPVEELMQRAIETLENVNTILADGDTRRIPADLRDMLGNVNAVAGSESLRNLPEDLRQALASVNAVLAHFEEEEGAQKLVAALEELRTAATGISAASADLPALVRDIDALVAKADALPLEQVVTSADQVLQTADTLLRSDDVERVPAALNAALAQAEQTLVSIREAAGSVNSTLSTFEEKKVAQTLVDALGDMRTAAANVETASAELPQLVADIDRLIATANALPLADVTASADRVLQSADAFLRNEDMDKVPGALAGALEEAQRALEELRQGGAVENLNRTLQTASTAADSVALAVQTLPDLAARLDALADSAEATIGAYGPGSPVNREVQAAIGDLRATVRSLNALVQAIRRKPNSLLVGR
ncbi:MCE family protein [Ruegeria pomeroyi]|uniref:Paraquat-inducible protein, putative n=2 Tax=Ruegeria pomeroyi TaxID=89184 RepID=Q5LU11_RUEPO|nr:MlaD family protein [Ruegeria pomeroyi]AAV94541.1 paraquat-inducible protein, putative [Ruegeria pomeroyi DSS-3]NVK99226.1 MCE family protein [Ruegeria pomeroyi]NVL01477.1 MCE family protein [Ruegeria pomeroyi]QWV08127.1 MCE family protein [Ruegeria pomeroyi]